MNFDYIECGNCLDLMRELPNDCVDLTVTSPPYDNLRDYKGYSFDFEPIATELYRITKPGGVVVWIVGDQTINGSETGTSFKQALYFKEIGFNLHDTMIYEKDGAPFPDKVRYYNVFEYMFVFSKGKPKTFNQLCDRKNKYAGLKRTQTVRKKNGELVPAGNGKVYREYGSRFNIWRFNTGKGKTTLDDYAFKHPAMFPEQLANDHIISWSNAGDIVFDPFLGSGTTAKMALLNFRHYIGFEISEEYFEIACKRLDDAEMILKNNSVVN